MTSFSYVGPPQIGKHRLIRFAITLALAMARDSISAEPGGLMAPRKSIGVLVDVSSSTNKEHHMQAKKVITSLIKGETVDVVSTGARLEMGSSLSPDLTEVMKRYFNASGQANALIDRGLQLVTMRIGQFGTTMESFLSTQVASASAAAELVDSQYPTKFTDQRTCFNFSLALVAERLANICPDGYYLFVVSDEADNPDYTAKGSSSYQKYATTYAEQYSVTGYIEPLIANHRLINSNSKRQRIAELTWPPMKGNEPMKLTWYALGAELKVASEAPPALVGFVPPSLVPQKSLLGGLDYTSNEDGSSKSYRYASPIIVAQWVGGSPESLSLKVEPSSPGMPNLSLQSSTKSPRSPKSIELNSPNSAPKGDYSLTEGGRGRISINPRGTGWWMGLAIASAVTAVAMFVYAWLTLRPQVVKTQ